MKELIDSNYIKKLGIIILEERAGKKMTQEQLAKASDLNRSYISDIETGNRNPSLKALLQISKGLDIPLSVLLLRTEFMLEEEKN